MALLSGREGSSAKQTASIGCGYVRFRSLQPRAHGWIRAGRSREQVLPALARSAHHLVANACAQQPIRAAVRDTARAAVTLRRAGVSTHAYGAAALADGDCAYDTVVHASTADRWACAGVACISMARSLVAASDGVATATHGRTTQGGRRRRTLSGCA
jgi:uncharacterized Zn-binding protein involved in type VI secretion